MSHIPFIPSGDCNTHPVFPLFQRMIFLKFHFRSERFANKLFHVAHSPSVRSLLDMKNELKMEPRKLKIHFSIFLELKRNKIDESSYSTVTAAQRTSIFQLQTRPLPIIQQKCSQGKTYAHQRWFPTFNMISRSLLLRGSSKRQQKNSFKSNFT